MAMYLFLNSVSHADRAGALHVTCGQALDVDNSLDRVATTSTTMPTSPSTVLMMNTTSMPWPLETSMADTTKDSVVKQPSTVNYTDNYQVTWITRDADSGPINISKRQPLDSLGLNGE